MKLVEHLNQNIFREYDIRGIYPTEINEDVAYTIGKSFGSRISQDGNNKALVGYDARTSSKPLHDALVKGIAETGVDVISLGLVTTPMYYFARYFLKIDTGIMITASHNPKEYNGFKMAFTHIGNAYGNSIKAFYDFTDLGVFLDGDGTVTSYDIKKEYLNCLKNCIQLGNRKIKVVVDCGNGTGSIIIKEILDQFPIQYDLLYCESNPDFPNHHPDPNVAKNMVDLQNRVVELGYDLGIGIDGDADRVGIVDQLGNIIAPDMVMLIVYRNIVNKMKTKKALFDVKCSMSLIEELKKLGIEPVMYRTGNSYTNMMMQKGDFDFGGEYSGHLFFRDKFPGFDDGIYAGLRMIEILSYMNEPFSSLLDGISHYESTEELKIKVTDENKFQIVEKVKQYAKEREYDIVDLDGVRANFNDGWALVRASNTGPNITMRFEAKTKERLQEIQTEFTSILNHFVM